VQFGRDHQAQWFDKFVRPEHASCISRSACAISWSAGEGVLAPILRVIGSGPVLVDQILQQRGLPVPLRPDSQVTLALPLDTGQLAPLVTFAVHFLVAAAPAAMPAAVHAAAVGAPLATIQPAQPAQAATPAAPAAPAAALVARPAVTPAAKAAMSAPGDGAAEGRWMLNCVYSKGLPSERLGLLPAEAKRLCFELRCGSPAALLGRSCQPGTYEGLLACSPQLSSFISRNHLELKACDGEEGAAAARLSLTNLSQNLVIAGESVLGQGEQATVSHGSIISFAMLEGAQSETVMPFLSFVLTAAWSVPTGGAMLEPSAPPQSADALGGHAEGADGERMQAASQEQCHDAAELPTASPWSPSQDEPAPVQQPVAIEQEADRAEATEKMVMEEAPGEARHAGAPEADVLEAAAEPSAETTAEPAPEACPTLAAIAPPPCQRSTDLENSDIETGESARNPGLGSPCAERLPVKVEAAGLSSPRSPMDSPTAGCNKRRAACRCFRFRLPWGRRMRS